MSNIDLKLYEPAYPVEGIVRSISGYGRNRILHFNLAPYGTGWGRAEVRETIRDEMLPPIGTKVIVDHSKPHWGGHILRVYWPEREMFLADNYPGLDYERREEVVRFISPSH